MGIMQTNQSVHLHVSRNELPIEMKWYADADADDDDAADVVTI